VAVLAVALVALLSVSSVSPELHAWLHQSNATNDHRVCGHHAVPESASSTEHASHPPGPDEGETHVCAVTLFGQGVAFFSGALLARPCEGLLDAGNQRAIERLALAQPSHLRPPPQAPPAI
jgi:hypothetical protein